MMMAALWWGGLILSTVCAIGIVVLGIRALDELEKVEEHLLREQKPTEIKIKTDD